MPTIDAAELRGFVRSLSRETGGSDAASSAVGESLVSADIRGHHSHGVRLLANKYIPEIEAGKITPEAEPVIHREHGYAAIIDGQQAFGQVTGRTAISTAIEKAKTHGIGVVGVTNTSHIGRIGEWAEIAAADDLAFLGFVSHPNSRWVAPAGTREGKLSTNPICFGLPSFGAVDFPLVLDMATSQVAVGKVGYYAARGDPLPDEWVLDRSGNPLKDASQFTRGDTPILPLGGLTAGYKGTGLAIMMELFSTSIADTGISGEPDSVWGNAASFVTIDLTRFTTPDRIADRITTYAEYLTSTPNMHSVGHAAYGDTLLLPGEAENAMFVHRREHGIPLPARDLEDLRDLATEYGIADEFPGVEREDRPWEKE